MIIKINKRKLIERETHHKVGLALSGGGIRGLAHIGILKGLMEAKIPIHMISGTSAGAIIATMFACGYTPQQMENLVAGLNMNELVDLNVTVGDLIKHGVKWFFNGKFRFWSVLPTGFIKGEKIEKFFSDLWGVRTMKDTKIPLAITAVDVNSADTIFFVSPAFTNRAILNARYYHNVLLTDAVRASISIPGIFHPKKYKGMTLVDGAVKNNLPTDILQHMGADIIIAVDLGYDGQPNYDIDSVGEMLMQCIEIMGREVTLLKSLQCTDIVIRPNTFDVPLKKVKDSLILIKRGEQAVHEKIHEIHHLLYQQAK